VTKETKIITVLLVIWLYFHWRSVTAALATGAAGSPGNATPGYDRMGGTWSSGGPGNRFPETWGSM